jgi:hypothetical protein
MIRRPNRPTNVSHYNAGMLSNSQGTVTLLNCASERIALRHWPKGLLRVPDDCPLYKAFIQGTAPVPPFIAWNCAHNLSEGIAGSWMITA